MKLATALVLSVFMMATACFAATIAAEGATEKQAVFLLCPHHERYGSWSLFLTVDKSDPSKPLSLGLEELVDKNSKDEGSYEKVIAAQNNPATERVDLGKLDAKSFGAGSLSVAKNNALNVTCTPDGETLKLMIDMRISADGHFIVGGAEAAKRNIVLKYNQAMKKWAAYATALQDKDGRNVVSTDPVLVTGLNFPVTATGIYRISAIFIGGKGILVYDK